MKQSSNHYCYYVKSKSRCMDWKMRLTAEFVIYSQCKFVFSLNVTIGVSRQSTVAPLEIGESCRA